MKYLLVYGEGEYDHEIKPTGIHVYKIEGVSEDVLNAVIDLIFNHVYCGIDGADELLRFDEYIEADRKIVSHGKTLQLSHEHPYALCDAYEVK